MTLKELVLEQEYTHISDEEVIAKWYETNDMAEKGLDIIYSLSKISNRNKTQKYNNMKANLLLYNCGTSLAKQYGIEIGHKLDKIIANYILEEMPNEEQMKWLKETIPTLEMPIMIWNDFYEFLKQNKIYFKGEKINV